MSSSSPNPSWHSPITVDLIARVLNRSIFHPFIAWLIPLCLRARAMAYDHPAMHTAVAYAALITFLWLLSLVNKRLAYGPAREVDLEDEVIVVTGGASGLGLLIAEVYGMRGASVAVLDIMDMDGEEKGIEYYKCDVGDREQVEKVAKQIENDLGTPTILINNAGIVNGKPLLELTPQQIERNFRVNLLSHFHTLQVFLPGMLRERRGTVVTVASVLGYLGCKRLADYTAAKAGLIALHSSLIAELPSSANIRTLLVTPGQLSTPLFAGVVTPSSFLGPVVEPVEVAKEIIGAIDAGVSGELAMPLYARWIAVLKLLPVSLQKLIRSASGLDKAMDLFVGRDKGKETSVMEKMNS